MEELYFLSYFTQACIKGLFEGIDNHYCGVQVCRLVETMHASHFSFIVPGVHSHCGGPRSIFVRDCSVFHGQWPCGRGELDDHVVISAFL